MMYPDYWRLEGFLRDPSILHPEDIRILALLVVANFQQRRPITQRTILSLLYQPGPMQPGDLCLALGHDLQSIDEVEVVLAQLAERDAIVWQTTGESDA